MTKLLPAGHGEEQVQYADMLVTANEAERRRHGPCSQPSLASAIHGSNSVHVQGGIWTCQGHPSPTCPVHTAVTELCVWWCTMPTCLAPQVLLQPASADRQGPPERWGRLCDQPCGGAWHSCSRPLAPQGIAAVSTTFTRQSMAAAVRIVRASVHVRRIEPASAGTLRSLYLLHGVCLRRNWLGYLWHHVLSSGMLHCV